MPFKTDKQRRGFFANQNRPSFRIKGNVTVEKPIQTNKRKVVILKNQSFKQLKKQGIKLSKKGDADGDGVPNAKDCKPLNKKEQGKIHKRIIKIKASKQFKNLKPAQKKKLNKALKELSKVTTREKLRVWLKIHQSSLIGSSTFVSLALAGGLPGVILGAGIGVGSKLAFRPLDELESPVAESLLKNRKGISKNLQEKGFTKKQANIIIKNKILQLEKKADLNLKKQRQMENRREINQIRKETKI